MELTNEDALRGWIGAIAKGDPRSLKALFEATSAYVHGLVHSILGSSDSVDDVLVETYTRIWKRADTYDESRGTVMAWISSFARNRAIDHLRACARDRSETVHPEELFGFTALDPTPLQISSRGEQANRIRRAVASLGDKQQRVIEAIFFQGLTHVQAAESLGEPLGTIKGRVRAAMNQLRQDLGLLEEGAI